MAHPQQRIQSEVELQAVKEELDLAKKTIDRYAHLVAKLYDEVDTLRNGICKTCKSKVVPGASPSSGAGYASSAPSPISLWRRVFGGWPSAQTVTGSPLSETQSTPDPRNAEPPTEQVSFGPTLVPPPAAQAQIPADVANSPVTEPDEDDRIKYNPEVRQSLDVCLAHTLKVKSGVRNLKFSRAGKYLAVGLYTGETYIYDMKTLSYRILTIVEGYPAKEQSPIYSMAFSSDDKYIATGSDRISVWNIAERRVLATFKDYTYTVDFSPDSRFLLSTSLDKSVRIWCIRDGSSKKLLDTDLEMSIVTSGAISGRYVAAGDGLGIIRIWDFRSGQLLQRWKAQRHTAIWSLVFTLDGKGLLSEGDNSTLRCWDIGLLMARQSGSRRREQVGGKIDEEMECLTFQGHEGSVNSISIFPDSRWVLSGAVESTALVCDLWTGAWQCILGGQEECVSAAASPDEQHLATGSSKGLVKVWRYDYTEQYVQELRVVGAAPHYNVIHIGM